MVLFEKKASLHSRTVNSHILPFHSKKYSNPIHLEAVAQRCYVKKLFLEISQNSQENTCARVSFLIKLQACDFIKKGTLAQVFSCEFCEILAEHLWVAASVRKNIPCDIEIPIKNTKKPQLVYESSCLGLLTLK